MTWLERHRTLIDLFLATIMVGLGLGLTARGDFTPAFLHLAFGIHILGSRITINASYDRGWMTGRRALFASMDEAGRRGLTMLEWIAGEAERDSGRLRRKTR